MRKTLAFLAFMVVSGCNPVVKTEYIGKPLTEQDTRNGIKYDYCYDITTGKFNFNPYCGCSYEAKVSAQNVRRTREDGTVDYEQDVNELEQLTECD